MCVGITDTTKDKYSSTQYVLQSQYKCMSSTNNRAVRFLSLFKNFLVSVKIS